jgi:hypothetical protein
VAFRPAVEEAEVGAAPAPSLQDSLKRLVARTAYAGAKAVVRTGEYFGLYPEARGLTSPLDEEADRVSCPAATTSVATGWPPG